MLCSSSRVVPARHLPRRMVTCFFTLALAPMLAVAGFQTSEAAIITQSQGFGGQPSLVKTVEFDRFDPSRGTLTSVEWRIILDIEGGSLTVDNDGVDPTTVDVKLGAKASLSSTDISLVDDSFQPILSGLSAVSASTGSVFNLAADNGDGMTFDPTMPDADTHNGGFANASGTAFADPTDLSDYLGTTMFNVKVHLDQLLDFGGVGGVSGQFDPVTAWPNVVLIYEYEHTPEPGSGSLAALGLGSWLLIQGRRRRSRRK